ncbi:hypothetical protein [Natrinema halophilum]|uniref:N-formyltransferase dimerization C-terminal domain-containing protein n=1 Tax=Natrinema halophilum TaxID=1699371 RepID=A0A7D5GH95_9EURY|nr:hypothetical protein [Natrinema halophilum]QLG48914.1 hypothetical protein HYG82_08650 [Natrinema halophilum]
MTEDFFDLCELGIDKTVAVHVFLNRLHALSFPPFDNNGIEEGGETYSVNIWKETTDVAPEGRHLLSY